jgi:4-hydroxy-3-methylbut-2-enyl diphosphate reductase
MIVSVETKSKPCPGVDRAITLAEDFLTRGENLYTIGQLIHNRREVSRLEKMGLHVVDPKFFMEKYSRLDDTEDYFLVRAHGEEESILTAVREKGLQIVDATCPIVRHSQELIDQHIREGWGIIIVGRASHPEVKGLLDRVGGNGIIISSEEEAESMDLDERSLLIAQTTIDPEFFTKIRMTLSKRLSGLKTVDTTCRFLRKRQSAVALFGESQDVVLLIGGKKSANCQLLYETVLKVNKRSYKLEDPGELNMKWFKNGERVGISGGASTPRWQLEEIKGYLTNHNNTKNPQGLKNRKGGTFLWWTWKNQNRTK